MLIYLCSKILDFFVNSNTGAHLRSSVALRFQTVLFYPLTLISSSTKCLVCRRIHHGQKALHLMVICWVSRSFQCCSLPKRIEICSPTNQYKRSLALHLWFSTNVVIICLLFYLAKSFQKSGFHSSVESSFPFLSLRSVIG